MIGVMFDQLNVLGKDCQKVIRLTFIKKLSHTEVAEELGYSLSFVKVKKIQVPGTIEEDGAGFSFF